MQKPRTEFPSLTVGASLMVGASRGACRTRWTQAMNRNTLLC